jgi:hypothetical protein
MAEYGTNAPEYGCDDCWPDDPGEARRARSRLVGVTTLVDESHFTVQVLACPRCGQRFLSVFTETIDWIDGDDPQSRITLPITADESDGLAYQGAASLEALLGALGSDRRSLWRDCPKGGEVRLTWGCGIMVRPHD